MLLGVGGFRVTGCPVVAQTLIHRIYKPRGKVVQLCPGRRVPILVAFYDLHGLQLDYSFPRSPYGEI